MIALKIPDVKVFMEKLLLQNVFDNFLISELEMNTFIKFQIQGRINRAYYSTDELEELKERSLAKWSEVKPYAYQMVRGHKTPVSFHILLQLTEENRIKTVEGLGLSIRPEEVSGLYMNIKYEANQLFIISGTGMKTFTLDKTLDKEWDDMTKRFLKKNEILFEE